MGSNCKGCFDNSLNTKKTKGIANCVAVNITIYLYFIKHAAYRQTFQKTIYETIHSLGDNAAEARR
jgi:hypothetical protein